MKKDRLKENIGYAISILVLLIVMLNPSVKSALLSGLMKLRLFEPNVRSESGGSRHTIPAETTFINSAGKPVSISQLKGKVVFINFWATWCPPCIAEMPSIAKLHNKLKENENVVFIAADADGNLELSEKFMKEKGYGLDVYALNSSLPSYIMNGSLPTTLIVNKHGEVVFRKEGLGNYDTDDVFNLLQKLSK